VKLEQESAQRRVRLLVRGHAKVPDGRCVLASCDGVAAKREDAPGAWPEENGLTLMARFPHAWLTADEKMQIEVEACAALGLDWALIRAAWIDY